MTKREDGGTAFPHHYAAHIESGPHGKTIQVYRDQPGMTLRDYFAAHAPAVSDERVREEVDGFPVFDNSGYHNGYPHETIREKQRKTQVDWMISARIKWRYQYADAMLAEREK